jgi:hypothetical protein
MNSSERKEGRRRRRKAKREERRLEMIKTYNFERVVNSDRLYRAMKDARRGVYWKASVQRYNMSFLRNLGQVSKDLKSGKDVRKGFICFDFIERGKLRHIRSVHFSERVVQRSLCSNALIPHLTRGLIYDNGASVVRKGIHFTLKRLKVHLMRHYRRYGTEGYVLLVDFKGYFDNILHEPILNIYRKALGEDTRLVELAMKFVDAFGKKGLGLGSETSQINAIAYPNSIDHYIKEVLRCRCYGRYMDDSYILCDSKERAKTVLDALLVKYAEKGIIANPKKTVIVKLTRGFTFLKTHFALERTGRVIVRPSRASAVRQRRKLKKFKRFLTAGKMCMTEIHSSYMSWRGYIGHTKSRRTVRNMDSLYKKLFGISPLAKNQENRRSNTCLVTAAP